MGGVATASTLIDASERRLKFVLLASVNKSVFTGFDVGSLLCPHEVAMDDDYAQPGSSTAPHSEQNVLESLFTAEQAGHLVMDVDYTFLQFDVILLERTCLKAQVAFNALPFVTPHEMKQA